MSAAVRVSARSWGLGATSQRREGEGTTSCLTNTFVLLAPPPSFIIQTGNQSLGILNRGKYFDNFTMK